MRRRFDGPNDNNDLVSLRLAHTDLHAKLESERAEASKALAMAGRALQVAEGERDQARLKCQGLAMDADRKEEQLRTSMDAVKGLRGELQRWRGAHEAARRHTDHVEMELQHVTKEVVPGLVKTGDDLRASLTKAQAQVEHYRQAEAKLKQELYQVRLAHGTAMERGRDLQIRLERERQELNRRKADDQVKEALDKAERAQNEAEQTALRDQIVSLTERCSSLTRELEESRRCQGELAGVRQRREIDQSTIGTMAGEMETVKADLDRARQQVADQERARYRLQEENEHLSAQLAQAERARADLDDKLRATKASRSAVKAEKTRLENELHRVQVEMGSSSGKVATLEDAVRIAQTTIRSLEGERQTAAQERDHAVERVGQEHVEVGEVRAQLELRSSEIAELTAKNDGMKELLQQLLEMAWRRVRKVKVKRKPVIAAQEIAAVLDADIRRMRKELRSDVGLGKRRPHRHLIAAQIDEKTRLLERLRTPSTTVSIGAGKPPLLTPQQHDNTKLVKIVEALHLLQKPSTAFSDNKPI